MLMAVGVYLGVAQIGSAWSFLGLILVLVATLLHARNALWGLIFSLPIGVFGVVDTGFLSLGLTDLFAILTAVGGVKILIEKKEKIDMSLLLWVGGFLLVGLISILANWSGMSAEAFKESLLYFIRLCAYYSLLLVVPIMIGKEYKKLLKVSGLSFLVLIILGFVQFYYFGDFLELELDEIGWDPHQGRLTSTWLDPNFLGGFLAFGLCFIVAHILESKKLRWVLVFLAVITAYALMITYSRSAYLAAAVGLGVITLIRARWLFVGAILAGIIFVPMSDRAMSRINDFYMSAAALMGDESVVLDPTARLRVENWKEALVLVKDNPIIGVGYGNYEEAQWKAGNLHDRTVHHSSGSDASLLTIWSTMGTVGLISFFGIMIFLFLRVWKNLKGNGMIKIYALGILAGSIAWLAHSFFVNSLFFAFILGGVIPLISIGITPPAHDEPEVV